MKADAELTSDFAARGDQAAFAELVRRHGGLVYRVCLRLLGDHHEAEDAAQAAFIVFARRAGSYSVRRGDLADWLHGMARHAALKALRARARRSRRERESAMQRQAEARPRGGEAAAAEGAKAALDEALGALPAGQRAAVVRLYLEGMSREEAAAAAGCRPETLAMRASRGLAGLRQRLARRGALVAPAALLALLAEEAAQAAPIGFFTTLSAAGACAGGAAGAAAGASAAHLLAKGVLQAMFWTKMKLAAGILAATLLAAGGTTAVLRPAGGGEREAENRPPPPAATSPAPAAAIVWGQAAGGLQAGIADPTSPAPGTINLTLHLRNVSQAAILAWRADEIEIPDSPWKIFFAGPVKGKAYPFQRFSADAAFPSGQAGPHHAPLNVTLAPGEGRAFAVRISSENYMNRECGWFLDLGSENRPHLLEALPAGNYLVSATYQPDLPGSAPLPTGEAPLAAPGFDRSAPATTPARVSPAPAATTPVSPPPAPVAAPAWGEEANGLQVGLVVEPSRAAGGDDLRLRLTLRNTGGRALQLYDADRFLRDSPWRFLFQPRGGGEPFRARRVDRYQGRPSGQDTVELPPGASRELSARTAQGYWKYLALPGARQKAGFSEDLLWETGPLLDFLPPGAYAVTAEFQGEMSQFWRGLARSGAVELTVEGEWTGPPPPSAPGAPAIAWGDLGGGLRLGVSAPAATFASSNDLALDLHLRNERGRPLVLEGAGNPGSPDWTFEFIPEASAAPFVARPATSESGGRLELASGETRILRFAAAGATFRRGEQEFPALSAGNYTAQVRLLNQGGSPNCWQGYAGAHLPFAIAPQAGEAAAWRPLAVQCPEIGEIAAARTLEEARGLYRGHIRLTPEAGAILAGIDFSREMLIFIGRWGGVNDHLEIRGVRREAGQLVVQVAQVTVSTGEPVREVAVLLMEALLVAQSPEPVSLSLTRETRPARPGGE